MHTITQFGHRTFASLKVRNYRLYFFGHIVSQGGSWMQTVALGWLVLSLTGSGVQLGTVTAMQFVPMLFLGPWGGVIVDRFSKLRLLYWTNTSFLVLVSIISVLIFAEAIQLWMLYLFAFALGLVRVLDNPARQTFVSEMVGEAHLKNAISLNSIGNNIMRAVGPSIAGILIVSTGIAFCFFVNALSYLAVLFMLRKMRTDELEPSHKLEKKSGQMMEGFRYVFGTPVIRNTLIMMAVIGTFAYEFQVSLPLLARDTFSGDATSYAALLVAMGVGSVVGGLYAAGRHTIVPRQLFIFAFLFGASIIATSLAPSLSFAVFGMFFVGLFSINLISIGNTMVQLESAAPMRGRVMALWSVAMIGSTTIGGPIIGAVGQFMGARWGLALGGVATILAAGIASFSVLKFKAFFVIPRLIQMRSEEATTENIKL